VPRKKKKSLADPAEPGVIDEEGAEKFLLSCNEDELGAIMDENLEKFLPSHFKQVFPATAAEHSIACIFDTASLPPKGPPMEWSHLQFSSEFIKAMDLVFESAGVLDKKISLDWFRAY
jgi:hypothetical protein